MWKKKQETVLYRKTQALVGPSLPNICMDWAFQWTFLALLSNTRFSQVLDKSAKKASVKHLIYTGIGQAGSN